MGKKITIILCVLLIGIGFGTVVYSKWNSPERALAETIVDVKKSGMEGLEKHLTDQSREMVEGIQTISEESILPGLLSFTSADVIEQFLKSKLAEIDWSLLEVMKGKKNSEAIIEFRYKEMIIGTIGIKMEKVKGKWMISGVGDPSIKEVLTK